MSTRSIVAVPHGDSWRGRYVHSDGYPSGVGADLWKLVERDGLAKVREIIVTGDHYGWSSLSADQPDIVKVKVSTKARSIDFEYGTPEYVAATFQSLYGDSRYVNVPDYGVAYTDTVLKNFGGQKEYQQVTEDQWLSPEVTNDTAWAYVLADDALWVLKCHFGPTPTLIGTYRWELAEPDWAVVEEGAS